MRPGAHSFKAGAVGGLARRPLEMSATTHRVRPLRPGGALRVEAREAIPVLGHRQYRCAAGRLSLSCSQWFPNRGAPTRLLGGIRTPEPHDENSQLRGSTLT